MTSKHERKCPNASRCSFSVRSLSVYPALDKRLRENYVERDNLIDLEQDRHT